jgi:hypothetical protein
MNTDIILTWMEAALKRDMHELRKELCVLRDILDGILDEWPEYVQKHLPAIRKVLQDMRQSDDVIAIRKALVDKAKEMGWTYSD